MFSRIRRLTPNQKKIWMVAGSVVVVGSSFKYAYFQLSRGMIVGGMEKNHVSAKKHLADARDFAQWSEKDRHSRLPPLTEEQKAQLQEYLDMVAETEFGEDRSSQR